MLFTEEEITGLNICDSPKNISKLLVNDFCGETYVPELPDTDEELIQELLESALERDMNYRQFNELLLLLNQDKVSRDFFAFIFEKDKITLDELKKGIIKFRGFAMLCFGNIRFAYKKLIQYNEDEIFNKIFPYYLDSEEIIKQLKARPSKMLDIKKIPKNKTWYLGYISGVKVDKDAERLEIEKTKEKSCFTKEELDHYEEILVTLSKEIQEIQKRALKNTDIYLTWDYMDIYIATSMRNKWEFEGTYDFIQDIENPLNEYNIRFFDPTQSISENPRDKGLIEGLMLKRALCTIYLAQETDTMGKDSELAATLAQRKPVIAYVPRYKSTEYSKKIQEYPLDFF